MTTSVMRVSLDQRARTKAEEGLRLNAYNDTVGISTIGWGHASTNPHPVRGLLNGEFYQGKPKAGVSITPQEAERLFDLDVSDVETGISALIQQELSQNQFDPLVDFCFQYGLDEFRESTLLAKLNFNPNNTDAIFAQFMRWTRAGGDHQEYVWRRSARRCCVYNGSPIPQALWRKNGFPFAITKDDKVDYTITPTIDKIIAYGKKASEKPVFDPSQPLPELVLEARINGIDVKAAPESNAQDVAGGAPQVTSPPAAPPAPEHAAASEGGLPDAKGAELVRPPGADVQAPQADTNMGASKPVSPESATLDPTAPQPPRETAPASTIPPVLQKQVIIPAEKPKAPPVHVDTSSIRTENMRVDQKPMEFSDRAMWFAVKMFGFWLKIMAGRGALPLTAVSYYFDFFNDPFLSSVVITGGTWLMGQCVETVGAWKLKLHRSTASTALV